MRRLVRLFMSWKRWVRIPVLRLPHPGRCLFRVPSQRLGAPPVRSTNRSAPILSTLRQEDTETCYRK